MWASMDFNTAGEFSIKKSVEEDCCIIRGAIGSVSTSRGCEGDAAVAMKHIAAKKNIAVDIILENDIALVSPSRCLLVW